MLRADCADQGTKGEMNMAIKSITRISTAAEGALGNGYGVELVFSPNGRFVAFESAASNLVPGDTNGSRDIFVMGLATGTMALANTAVDGTQGIFASHTPALLGGFSPLFLSAAVVPLTHEGRLRPAATRPVRCAFPRQ
jgi:hypothetical protein